MIVTVDSGESFFLIILFSEARVIQRVETDTDDDDNDSETTEDDA